MLRDPRTETGEALESLRDLAQGIYPPCSPTRGGGPHLGGAAARACRGQKPPIPHLARVSAHPHWAWVTQQAGNPAGDEDLQDIRVLLRDRDARFSGSLDEVFRTQEVRVIRPPVRAPRANAVAERQNADGRGARRADHGGLRNHGAGRRSQRQRERVLRADRRDRNHLRRGRTVGERKHADRHALSRVETPLLSEALRSLVARVLRADDRGDGRARPLSLSERTCALAAAGDKIRVMDARIGPCWRASMIAHELGPNPAPVFPGTTGTVGCSRVSSGLGDGGGTVCGTSGGMRSTAIS
jgi:hypothetical protein